MKVAVQYYRPSFPERKDWARDLVRIRDVGIDAVQLWVTWGWVEAEPGCYVFDDYDEIIRLASDAGLEVIVSTIAEVQPFWIHRLVPDSLMIDHLGRTVPSVPRRENAVGLTPGGCTDHPEIRRRMTAFLAACGEHFTHLDNLAAWDVWNENRWAVHASGHVCYCRPTVRAFRDWLQERHGDLAGLNRAWRRRYSSWDDVWPGTRPALPYSEQVEFQRFLTWRAGQHMALRADTIRAADPDHPITAHGVAPSVFSPGQGVEQAVSRGNDWDHVTHLDGYGLSMYPDFFIHDEADFGARIEAARSACGDKQLWVSELEAAPTGVGFTAGRPVSGDDLRRWIGVCADRGVDSVMLWQWYDERVGEESASFGLAGDDALAEERLATLTMINRERTAAVGARSRPRCAEVGVLFDEGGYYLDWAQHGADADLVSGSMIGYLRALERLDVSYDVLDSRHLGSTILAHLRLIVCPAPLMLTGPVGEMLAGWVRAGGHLLVEAGAGSYDPYGIYCYPDDRPFAAVLGIHGGGRAPHTTDRPVHAEVGATAVSLRAEAWQEPVRAPEADATTKERWSAGRLGDGRVMTLGTFAGLGYYRARYRGFEDFVGLLCTSAAPVADARGR